MKKSKPPLPNRKYNLPKSWDKMAFDQKQYYLVDTHQSKHLCDAARVITKMTNDKLRASIREAYQAAGRPHEYWWDKES